MEIAFQGNFTDNTGFYRFSAKIAMGFCNFDGMLTGSSLVV